MLENKAQKTGRMQQADAPPRILTGAAQAFPSKLHSILEGQSRIVHGTRQMQQRVTTFKMYNCFYKDDQSSTSTRTPDQIAGIQGPDHYVLATH